MFGNVARVLSRIQEIERRFGACSPRQAGTRSMHSSPSPSSFEEVIAECAEKYRVNPALVRRLIQVESGGNPRAMSPKGAMGLMQLMPETCRELGVVNPFDVRENIEGGVRYLRRLLDRFESLELALAAYNAGPGRVREYGGVPPFKETREFIRKVLEG